MILINFKNYKTGSQVNSFLKKIGRQKIIAIVPALQLHEAVKQKNLTACAQHVDVKKGPRDTGFVTPRAVKQIGVNFTLLNHSEHQIPLKQIKETIKECKKYNLQVILCIKNLSKLNAFKKLKPYAIAYEDARFIASKTPITKFPKPIISFVKNLSKTTIIPLCGAGINSKEDVQTVYRLGCKGMLISSWIMKSKNPNKFLKEIV